MFSKDLLAHYRISIQKIFHFKLYCSYIYYIAHLPICRFISKFRKFRTMANDSAVEYIELSDNIKRVNKFIGISIVVIGTFGNTLTHGSNNKSTVSKVVRHCVHKLNDCSTSICRCYCSMDVAVQVLAV